MCRDGRSSRCTTSAAKLIYEAVVDLGARVIDSWKSVPGRFPSYLVEHMTGVEEVVASRCSLAGGDAQARCHRFRPRNDRSLARRLLRHAGPLRQLAADLPAADVHACRARPSTATRGRSKA